MIYHFLFYIIFCLCQVKVARIHYLDCFPGKGNWMEIVGAILVFIGALLAPVYDVLKSRMSSKTVKDPRTQNIVYKPVTQKIDVQNK